METLTIDNVNYVVITRADGSKLTIEANESNPEYAALLETMEEN
jgi:hypothetical protein